MPARGARVLWEHARGLQAPHGSECKAVSKTDGLQTVMFLLSFVHNASTIPI